MEVQNEWLLLKNEGILTNKGHFEESCGVILFKTTKFFGYYISTNAKTHVLEPGGLKGQPTG